MDPVTGVFNVSGQHTCFPYGDHLTSTLSGTFSPGGDMLAGSLAAGINTAQCFLLSGSVTGALLSTTCGDGTTDPGEACDEGPAGTGCCTVLCEGVTAGTPCSLTDFFCGLPLEDSQAALCPGCSLGRCDGGGACVDTPLPAGRICRAAVNECDIAEACDGTSLTCPPDQVVPGPDTDGDGKNDLCDPCTGGGAVSKQRLVVKDFRLSPDVKIHGRVTLADPSAVDPVQHGLRVVVEDSVGTRFLDTTAPPNPPVPPDRGWRATDGGWSYKARRFAPIVAVKIRLRADPAGALDLSIRTSEFFIEAPPQLPMNLTLVLDPPFATTGLCGEAAFPGPPGVNPSCALVQGNRSLSCH
jgi:hypothetical protein